MSVVSDALEIISESARHANDSMKKTVSHVLRRGRRGTVGDDNGSLVLTERNSIYHTLNQGRTGIFS